MVGEVLNTEALEEIERNIMARELLLGSLMKGRRNRDLGETID